MRRKSFFIALAGITCVTAALALLPHFLTAQPVFFDPPTNSGHASETTSAGEAKASAANLPVKKVILFTSGVGYFQREGQLDGDARVDLSFPVQDINDLLKSLVLRDTCGGKIRTISYDSQAPIDKSLKSFAVNLSGNPSFADILNQSRGERVSISYNASGGQSLTATGTIVSVEHKQQFGVPGPIDVESVNLWGDKGLQCIKLPDVVQVKFHSPALAGEMNRALEVVAQAHDTHKKTVSLLFSGHGSRAVQVGYVVEHPIWKTSYRMVLSKDSKPFLQGWGLVENPTSEDWNNVQLSLVSGRPVSFKMDLYQPLYVDRPTVQLQTMENLKPMAYEGEMGNPRMNGPMQPTAMVPYTNEADMTRQLMLNPGAAPMAAPPMPYYRAATTSAPMMPMPVGAACSNGCTAMPTPIVQQGQAMIADMKQTVTTLAQGMKCGEQFQYVLNQPVSVPRQKSALVPIMNVHVEGSRVSIFNEQNLAKFPMLGLKFKNTTLLHLMQGPITVFAEDGYAGDALIQDMEPGEERLLSYAVDTATEVKVEHKESGQHYPGSGSPQPYTTPVVCGYRDGLKPASETQVTYSLVNGILYSTATVRRTSTYTVKNRSDQDKVVILEHPIAQAEWKIVSPTKDPAKTQNFYRFELNAPANSTKSLDVIAEMKVVEQVQLVSTHDQALEFVLKSTGVSPQLKAILHKALDLRGKLTKTQVAINKLNNDLQVINGDQARQRENMKVIPQSDPVYKTYLNKFLKQEEQIDTLRVQLEQLQATAEQQRQAYEQFVINLTLKEEKE